MSVVDSQSLEVWVQSGIPEEGELVFNVHFRNSRNVEWEVYHDYSIRHIYLFIACCIEGIIPLIAVRCS